MKKSDMSNYMREEMWMDRVEHTISVWEHTQGVTVPDEAKKSVTKFMRAKIKQGIKKGTLMKVFFQIAVTSLIYIRMRKK